MAAVKPLLVVESPTKARTISKYTGGEYEVIACVGHVKDLPRKELGVDVENEFKMTLQVLPDRRDFIKSLKAKAKAAGRVVLATDPDREGEAIADHLASEIASADIERVQFTEITLAGIQEGMSQRRPIDDNLVEAQKARRIIDRLVGYKVSPILWNTLQKTMKFVSTTLSAGRVQSAAVKILVDRERQRVRFKSAEYYDLEAELTTAAGEPFKARLSQVNSRKMARGNNFDKDTGSLINPDLLILSKTQAAALAKELKPGPWEVAGIVEKPQTSKPRPPFTTATLQQEAARKLRLSSRRTMRLAQQLYEAGFITYMRTDSTHLSGEAFSAAREIIKSQFSAEYLPATPIQYVTKVKNAQEAHEAIRPAGIHWAAPGQVAGSTSAEAARLYDLIWKRTVASQMKPARLKQTVATIICQKSVFEARGKVIVFPGFMRVYVEGSDDPQQALLDQETVLPVLTVKELLDCQTLNVLDHVTQPPPRFTEATIVKELEARGIGRPSTYAAIIETIQRREYVIIKKGTLIPTFLAVAVTQLLENHFTELVDSGFTARMEDNLDAISRGDASTIPVMKSFYFGDETFIGLETMLNSKVDIRKACTIPVGTAENEAVETRIGNYGPYLTWKEERKSIPAELAPGDITLEKALEIIRTGTEPDAPIGKDPATGLPVFLKRGPYGTYVQLGETDRRKSIPKNMQPEDVEAEYALQLLTLPRELGVNPATGEVVTADYGRYGPYLKMGKTNAKLPPNLSPLTVTLEQALPLFEQKPRGAVELKSLGVHPETGAALTLKEGRYGAYITDGKINAALPKNLTIEEITVDLAVALIEKKRAAGPPKRRRRKK